MKRVFDGYSEKARRAIFFARYEAGQFDSSMVESEHLLLGIMREDKAFMRRLLASSDLIDSIRTQIEARTPVQREIAIITPPEMLKERAAGSPVSFESVRKLIEANPFFHERMAKNLEHPFSDECTRAMSTAEHEANRRGKKPIGTEFLLLGILGEDTCYAATLLRERGVTAQVILKQLS